MTRMIFVNLPVRDLQASDAFYRALGGMVNPRFSDEQATCLLFSDAIGVMLLTHGRYRQFTSRPIGDARAQSQALAGAERRDPRQRRCGYSGDSSRRRHGRSQPAPGSRLHV